ncbi:hypothetical protein DH2020_022825 [Rehmannia glutinosa]|uniref:Polygalacturonase-like protein n=1 Tax=Rehmannia glutinosa TaxID=99300 RepID=A0ABR0W555_REHGL
MMQNFLKAWKEACRTNGGVLLIPLGTYLVRDATFQGPCRGQTKVNLKGTLKATSDLTLDAGYWIGFSYVENLIIYGNGTFDGNGASAWGCKCQNCKLPISISFAFVRNSKVQDINSVNSKSFHMNIFASQNMTLDNVGISAPGNSPNTDGIHIGKSNNIRINNAHIGTGDDCIAMLDGSTNVNISRVSCGPGHGISIGSLGTNPQEKDVSSITVSNCTLTNTTNGLRIKTVAPSQPINVYNIRYQHIIMNNVQNPIIIDQHYCPSKNCPKAESSVQIKDVKYDDVRGSSATKIAVNFDCSRNKQCQDIHLSGVNLTFKGQPTTASCSSANIKFIGPKQTPSGCS